MGKTILTYALRFGVVAAPYIGVAGAFLPGAAAAGAVTPACRAVREALVNIARQVGASAA